MPSHIKMIGNNIGFGNTQEEALNDAYINASMNSLSNDKDNRFIKRREELHPWMPKANILHISEVGCLVYENKQIRETKSGRSVIVAATGMSVFQYLATLFDTKLSYTDIVCVLREEIDTFFQNISTDFVSIKEMPIIQVQRDSTEFVPTVLYKTNMFINIGVAEQYIGVKFVGEDCYYTCPITQSSEQMAALHRLLYRIGYVMVGEEILELEESDEDN